MSSRPELSKDFYTADEYFDFLLTVDEKYEYNNGQIRYMAGGTANHSRIKSDTTVYLGTQARGSACEPFDSDMAVYVPKHNSYVLPDLSFVCEASTFGDEAQRRLLNPNLLIEVMSESSESYDRGEKFQKYRSLTSFREYILIDSQRYAVEGFYKQDDKLWQISSCFELEGAIRCYTLDVDVPLKELYRRVRF